MFLTGFDATTLNTLWVDKNLRHHGLLQAFSRTNRILNSVKTHGNIVCFRNLEKATNDAIALFGNKEARGIVLLRSYQDYYNGYHDGEKEIKGYKELIQELLKNYPVDKPISSEEAKKEFIKLYGQILRVQNILSTFDEFKGNEILTERQIQDYHSIYIDLYQEFRKRESAEKEIINDDLIFEIELIKQIEINIDYILDLVKKYHEDHDKNREILTQIEKSINATIKLRNKKELIAAFIQSLDANSVIDEDWPRYVEEKMKDELDKIIEEENLNPEATKKFIQKSFSNGFITDIGTEFASILPPISRFSKDNERTKKREKVLSRLKEFFEIFYDILGTKNV